MSTEHPSLLDGAIAPSEQTRLFGHAAAEAFLAQSYRSGKGHHAVLIEGPEGVGKATLAFRFAHHILSHPDPRSAPETMADPDPASPLGRQIASGASHNLLHLSRPVDEKTGKMRQAITIDEVRRAGKFFAQTSGTGNWRIVIVDPADDLNRNAANAILKILEEPPRNAMFLVLTDAPGKLLPTIRSRCLPLTLGPLSGDDLSAALGNLGVALPATGPDRLLKAAGGSVATALKLVNYGGFEILEAFQAIVAQGGSAPRKDVHKLADVLAARDGDTLYDFFCGQVNDHIVAGARAAALTGDLQTAERLARLSSALADKIGIAAAYNLDRKQTVIEILDEVAAQGGR